MALKQDAALPAGEQIRLLRERLSDASAEHPSPAASQAAPAARASLEGALDYMPVLLEYAGPVLWLLRRKSDGSRTASIQAPQAGRNRPGLGRRVYRTTRSVVMGTATLAACYGAYRLAHSPGKALAQPRGRVRVS